MLEEYSDDVRICTACGIIESSGVPYDSCRKSTDYYHAYLPGWKLKEWLQKLKISTLTPEILGFRAKKMEEARLQREEAERQTRERNLKEYQRIAKELGIDA